MRALMASQSKESPAKLAKSLKYATIPGGARIRPTILMSVSAACGDEMPLVTDAAAAALELIHCASLVHDDLPCFDDADIRRGKPSVHKKFSEAVAVLAGDSLIILAFEILSGIKGKDPYRALELIEILSKKTGMPNGICAGQGWESESKVDLAAYHRSKTAALFVAATQMGAVAAGQDPEPWHELGDRIGKAFQIADDLRDVFYDPEVLGKPAGQDLLHGRPNAVGELGIEGAQKLLHDTLSGAISSIPSCPGEAKLAQMVTMQAKKLIPVSASATRV